MTTCDYSNKTMNNSSTDWNGQKEIYKPEYYFVISLMILTDILILSLNTLSLFILPHVSSIPEASKVFFTSLTIADLTFGIFTVLPTVIHFVVDTWPFGDALCQAVGSTNYVFFGMSILSLLLLTADRYIAIFFSLRYYVIVTVMRARIIVCATWIVGGFGLTLWDVWGDPTVQKCSWKDPGEGDENYMFTLSTLGVILILYGQILWVAHKQARQIAHDENQVSGLQPNGPRRRSVNIKAANTVIIIAVALGICWIPDIIRVALGPDNLSPAVDAMCDLLLMCNSWMNVVIYYVRHKDFRQAFHRLVQSRLNPIN